MRVIPSNLHPLTTLLLAVLFLVSAAACGSSSPETAEDRDRAKPRAEPAETRDVTAPSTEPAGPETTGQGILGRSSSPPATGPEATGEAGQARPILGGGRDSGTAKIEFVSVSAGRNHTCRVQRDGSVACWGDGKYGQSTPPAGEFASVSAGGYYTCGVQRDGSVACWGDDEYGQATPPAGKFASVSAGF